MTTDGLRKAQLWLSVVWLCLLVLGSAGGALGLPVVVVGVAALAGYWLFRRAWPRLRRAWRSSRPRTLVEVELAAPGPRAVERSPISLSALAKLLQRAELGAVTVDGSRLSLVDRNGETVHFAAAFPDLVTRSTLQVTTSALELAVLACDALAPRLGAVEFRAEGIRLTIDGTSPRAELERQLYDARMAHLERMRNELDAEPPPPKPRGPQLLN